jgi:hypothetical protein
LTNALSLVKREIRQIACAVYFIRISNGLVEKALRNFLAESVKKENGATQVNKSVHLNPLQLNCKLHAATDYFLSGWSKKF